MLFDIDVTSDVICPWCYIGKRRLEKAVAVVRSENVRVRWHPFQLNPQMPKSGMNRKDYRTAKFGSWERSLELDAQVAAAGRTEGLAFAFDKIERTPNTLDAHRLIWLADQERIQDAVVEALFRAYFVEGLDITHVPNLLDVATRAGLERNRAEALLIGDQGMSEIQTEEEQAHRAGIHGVPLFTINGKTVLSGAQEVSVFLEAFNQAGVRQEIASEAGACKVGPGGERSC